MADSKSTEQTIEEHPGQTLTTTDHDVIRDWTTTSDLVLPRHGQRLRTRIRRRAPLR
jgi:hypothetical protein